MSRAAIWPWCCRCPAHEKGNDTLKAGHQAGPGGATEEVQVHCRPGAPRDSLVCSPADAPSQRQLDGAETTGRHSTCYTGLSAIPLRPPLERLGAKEEPTGHSRPRCAPSLPRPPRRSPRAAACCAARQSQTAPETRRQERPLSALRSSRSRHKGTHSSTVTGLQFFSTERAAPVRNLTFIKLVFKAKPTAC